ncbi:MAG TPA: PQQ-binding-like beta-propeller repeat protein [Bryobacteraceae bacterium]|nr:PQQ-binding-like beta-propeller repeat protein [Bryobacteraceae bacterium]
MRIPAIFLLSIAISAALEAGAPYHEWTVYGGGPDNIRYSALDQINRTNVAHLKVAWTYDTGDAFPDSEMECNPIIVNGLLYTTTPKLRLIALDAATGKLRWSFDPRQNQRAFGKARNRGVTYWADGADRRIFFVAGHWLYALDARTGARIKSFGEGGRVDLRQGLGRPPEEMSISATSPGIVYKDLLIMGSIVSETLPAAPGDIRAYDARTGKIRWTFHTIPHPGEFGYDTWPKDAWQYIGAANNWAGMSLDEKRGLVFIPTGSAAFDFYGANRKGDDLFANTLLALRADTGERVWHFQAVHHDLWDRDFPAPPNLVSVQHDGRMVDAVAQITKSGHVFVFDRQTGKPLFPLEERPVPATEVDGEATAATQPLPLAPPPFARQIFTPDMVTNRTPAAHAAVLARLRKVRSAGQFVPPSLEGTVIFPGFDGGAEWGGAAFDPASGWLYVNANEMPWILRLVDSPHEAKATGRGLYNGRCAGCHRQDLKGSPPEFPALTGIATRRTREQIAAIVHDGNGRMPAFPHLPPEAVSAIITYLTMGEDLPAGNVESSPWPIAQKYRNDGYNKFLDPDGYPAVEPPWGTLSAIDLNKGKIAWQIPFGEYPELAAKGLRHTGSENYGGPVVTAGGLLFIGATIRDRKFHAFDKATGKLLWETTLPAAGNATPATYEVNGRQFVVVACGGGKWGAPSGGNYVAFALP